MNRRALGASLLRSAGRTARRYLRSATTAPSTPPADDDPRSAVPYPGDYTGRIGDLQPVYHPEPDGEADAGEVVWAWVPYEDDPDRGKDRPVLVIGHEGPWLLALMMTSKDHDRDAAQEARAGRHWMDVGTGGWDSRGRPSEVRLDRVLRLAPGAVRREGAALDRRVFDSVAGALADGW